MIVKNMPNIITKKINTRTGTKSSAAARGFSGSALNKAPSTIRGFGSCMMDEPIKRIQRLSISVKEFFF